MMKVTHSAALEPPTPRTYCEDCEFTIDYCRCGHPTCENCGHYTNNKIIVDDEEWSVCEKCARGQEPS